MGRRQGGLVIRGRTRRVWHLGGARRPVCAARAALAQQGRRLAHARAGRLLGRTARPLPQAHQEAGEEGRQQRCAAGRLSCGDPGLAQRCGAAGRSGPHRMGQPHGVQPARLRPSARPGPVRAQSGAPSCLQRLSVGRRFRTRDHHRRRWPAPLAAGQDLTADPPLRQKAQAHDHARHHRGATRRGHAARLRGQRIARNPHAAHRPQRLRRDHAEPGAQQRGAPAVSGTHEPAGAPHADAGERPADALAPGGQPRAGAGRMVWNAGVAGARGAGSARPEPGDREHAAPHRTVSGQCLVLGIRGQDRAHQCHVQPHEQRRALHPRRRPHRAGLAHQR